MRASCSISLLLLVISACISVEPAVASTLIRGASPDNVEKYTPNNGKFTCFDGSLTIDFSQVNDNFCDCPDSSDEPGTSACPHGVFYCRNRGHEPRIMATSFVDDGICDCCDGTDELSGCKNTCIEKNSAKREAIKKQIDDYQAALDQKAQYAAGAAAVRSNIKQRHANVDSDIEKAEKDLERLTDERKRVEDETEVKRDAHQKEQVALAAKRKAEAEARRKVEEQEAAAAAQKAADDAAAAAAAGTSEGQPQGDDAAQEEETDEERGRRIASQWTNDPAAAGTAAPAEEDAAASEKDVSAGSWSLSSAWNKARDSVNKLVNKGGATAPSPEDEHDYADLPSSYDEEDGWSPSDDPAYEAFDDGELQQALSAHKAAETMLADLRAEKERVARQIHYNFNDAWAGLLNKCLESREPQFTYRFCFFDKATQVDNGGGHVTNLGFWKGFENGGTEAVFDGGDYCHQNPARSMRVKLECGGQERAWEASEPSTCSYMIHASTPAACKAERLQELQDTMDALLAEEAALAKEIEQEEKERAAQLAGLRDKISGGSSASHDEL